jgi:uncharacterized surface protein with fasciclin (FAS1) repeats
MKKSIVLGLFLVLVLIIGACAPQATPEVVAEPTAVPTPEPEPTEEPSNTIVDIAVNDGRFTTLVAALQAAELVETLQGDGPFTVFAPTDDAFAALPAGTVEALLADIPALTDILLYHVVAGDVRAADVIQLEMGEAISGLPFEVKVDGGMVYINEAQVIITDIVADNGVIHVIDAVLLPPMDIVDTAVADGRFTTLAAALTAADLIDTLKGEGPFTVFAPTDDAFAKLPEGTVEALLEDIPALTDILLYHVVEGRVKAAQVVELEVGESISGAPFRVRVEDGRVFINDAEVIITDIFTSNGTIHVIDSVLLPPQDIVDTAVADGRFTTLAAALTAADLIDTLKGEGPFTVFAPTDAAFAALPAGTVEALLNDIPALTDILLYHVAEGRAFASTVVTLDKVPTLQGRTVTITIEDGNVFLNNAQVIITDIFTSNGVIHVIDAVLIPPKDIVETAVADGRFTTLAAALTAADLIETLQGEGPFTVFAPTDAAFATLPEGTVEALLEDIPTLTDILLYHVVAGEVMAEDVVELQYATTVQGNDVLVKVNEQGVFINNARVIITDIETYNGVIHVIDSVLLPPKDIVETAVEDGRFTTLAAALEAADLIETLEGEGPFTVFAPTDDAFAALPAGTVEALLEDIPALTNILLYHVVEGRFLAADVLELEEVESLSGEIFSIKIENGNVYLNDTVMIIITDILASNGVIHVIDAVLLP